MSTGITTFPYRKALLLTAGYALVYFAASGLDLWTTVLALHRPDTFEGNVFATSSGSFDGEKAWLMTDAAGVLMTVLFALGIWYADRMSPDWLRRPIRSFFYWRFNPLFIDFWSRRTRDRAPLHAVSFAIAFAALRLLAAGNNLIIAAGYTGPLGAAVRAAGRATTPAMGLILAMGAAYIALAVLLSPLGASLLQSLRSKSDLGPATSWPSRAMTKWRIGGEG